jgi:hypothetical protein
VQSWFAAFTNFGLGLVMSLIFWSSNTRQRTMIAIFLALRALTAKEYVLPARPSTTKTGRPFSWGSMLFWHSLQSCYFKSCTIATAFVVLPFLSTAQCPSYPAARQLTWLFLQGADKTKAQQRRAGRAEEGDQDQAGVARASRGVGKQQIGKGTGEYTPHSLGADTAGR